jgi:hypothetical protein
MRQALHIFKKDVRYLRYDIGITLLAAAAFCLMGTRRMPGPGPTALILPVTWWFLIARVIHAEPLPGNHQFWVTRPYHRKSLLGAKAIFILTFVNLPLLIADAAIIHAAGFSLGTKVPGLLWTQVLLVATFVLPAMAVSAITNGFVELLVATLVLTFVILARLLIAPLVHQEGYWMQLEWVKTYYLLVEIDVAAASILFWQYARRNTFATRTLAVVTALAVPASGALLPWTAAFALQTHLSRQKIDVSSVRIELDSERKWSGSIYAVDPEQVVADIPLQVNGLPTGMELRPNGLTMALRAFNGEAWVINQPPPNSVDFESGSMSLRATMARTFYESVKHQPLQLRGTLYFTVYRKKLDALVPLDSVPVRVSGLGLCSASTRFLLCNSAFRPQSDWISIRISQESPTGPRETREGLSSVGSYSPFPADFNIDPLHHFSSARLKTMFEARVEALEPVAYVERNFEIDHLRLDDFPFHN